MKCIKCGDKVRNKRSCLCQKCFDEALKRKIETPAEKMF